MEQRRLHIQDYTVGWVCALPIELAAAAEMLDEEHQDLPPDADDTNLYTLGCIGEHNVVIACLPAGQIGTNSAATVAAQMKSKFVSIRFGLMVGIGGGVPSGESDVRLGDVVVSQPYMQHGGVIQFDFGKTTPSGFVRTGFINTPPTLLLNALAKLQANNLRRRSNVLEYLSALSHLPKFTRENAGADILFESTYSHVGGSTCEQCSRDRVVGRTSCRSQEVVVHYGTIASGNQVMRDGIARDRLSSELGGVLCFEMEAAGLMNSFPCLVIRGICDYADSHKNKRWQPYAAATAAACAKEVLSVIPAAEVARTRTVDETIQGRDDTHKAPWLARNAHFVGHESQLNELGAKRRRVSDLDLDFEHYTVAWIAPLEIEAQAAWYMLDHEHKGNFTISRGDDYVYTAGDINGHNVIIATFPSGQDYGVGSAAALASQVKKSFPNLWFGLLVGVAAGLPNLSRVPPRDIRLGDVLVGVGEGDDAGLVSYGLGKETSDGFQLLRHGVQAKTETVVRSVIGSIKALAPMHGNVFLQYYESIKDKKHSNGTFADPGQERDQLYQIVDDENGPVTKLVERPLRHPSERTKVWYGPIGSGDKLMKNAKKRDELRDKFNLIGLEMEAAGTTNTIPVSVIRGVCDYGDTQKNKEWQPYAAAMAAAYAKAVLYKIRPSKPGFGRGYQPPNLASSPNPFGGNAGTPTYPFPQNLFSPEPGVGALGYFRPARYEASHGAPRYSDVMTPYGQAPGYGYPGYGLPQPGPRSQFYAQFGQQPENVTELQKALEDTRRERNRREIGEKRFAATMEEEKKRREAEEKKLAALERLLEDTKHDAARCKKIVEERETEERKLAAMIEEEKKKREAEEKKLADLERLLGDTKHEAERYKKIVEERETEERKLATMMEEERKKREAEEKKLVTLEWFLEDATKER